MMKNRINHRALKNFGVLQNQFQMAPTKKLGTPLGRPILIRNSIIFPYFNAKLCQIFRHTFQNKKTLLQNCLSHFWYTVEL